MIDIATLDRWCLTQALALTRTKSPKKDSSMPTSPSHTGGRESEMASPKGASGAVANVSSASSNSSSAEPQAERAHSISSDGGNGSSSVNHALGTQNSSASSNGALAGSSTSTSSSAQANAGQAVRDLGAALHPAISVSQSLLAAAATVSRSVTPRISVSTSLTAPENGPSAGNGPSGHPGSAGTLQTNPSNGPGVDRAILQSPVAAVAAAAAAMQDRKQDFDFSKVNGRSKSELFFAENH
ncbi:AGAP006641-PA-like protein [Anopheles sinensis]|uniref:AGAP006641-PA-like protein n=1 Tax=Anopheles sinensis TaxID=74873 RepID=A0A084WME3_ANOSI|nr:AGAP006641-PA-like protein [Anopheles sinensis]